MKHANILLAVDTANGKTKDSDANIAKQFHCHINTVYNVKQCFVEQGFDSALNRKRRETPGIPFVFDGRTEAELTKLACSKSPEGRATWTLRLLADKCVELEIVPHICYETVRKVLKKRIAAAEERMLGNSAGTRFRVCCRNGRRTRHLRTSF